MKPYLSRHATTIFINKSLIILFTYFVSSFYLSRPEKFIINRNFKPITSSFYSLSSDFTSNKKIGQWEEPIKTLLSCHVRVSEWIYTHSCLNVKELFARNRRDMVKTLHGWVFVYKLSGCGFECRCCHLMPLLSLKSLLIFWNMSYDSLAMKNGNGKFIMVVV